MKLRRLNRPPAHQVNRSFHAAQYLRCSRLSVGRTIRLFESLVNTSSLILRNSSSSDSDGNGTEYFVFIDTRLGLISGRFGVNSLSCCCSREGGPGKGFAKLLVSGSSDTVEERDFSGDLKVETSNWTTGSSETSRSLKYPEMIPEAAPRNMASANIRNKNHFGLRWGLSSNCFKGTTGRAFKIVSSSSKCGSSGG